MKKLRLAVLISGRGSNLQALIDACAQADYPAEIAVVVSNRPDAQGLERAAKAGIPAMIVDNTFFKGDKAEFEASLAQTIEQFQVDLICLAGFMRILSADFLRKFNDMVINIHPSLLPAYKGLDTHARALAAGDVVHGCTVHVVTPEMDGGDIILQRRIDVLPGDTAQTLAERLLAEEHLAYAQAVQQIAQKHVILRDGKVIRRAPAETPNSAYREHIMTTTHQNTDHTTGHPTNGASPEAIEDARLMWQHFARVFTYTGGAAALVLILLAIFVA